MTKIQVTCHLIDRAKYQRFKTHTRLHLKCSTCNKPIKYNDFYLLDNQKMFAGFRCCKCYVKQQKQLIK
jgi:hypothetical protein